MTAGRDSVVNFRVDADRVVDKAEYDRIIDGTKRRLVISGTLSYYDIFDERHESEFCYVVGGNDLHEGRTVFCGQHTDYN